MKICLKNRKSNKSLDKNMNNPKVFTHTLVSLHLIKVYVSASHNSNSNRGFPSRKRIHGLCPIHNDYNCSVTRNDKLKTQIGYFGKEFCYCDKYSLKTQDSCSDYLSVLYSLFSFVFPFSL